MCTPGSKCTGGTIQLCAAQSDTQFYSDVSGATNCKICLNGTVSDSRDSCTCLDTFFKTGDKCEGIETESFIFLLLFIFLIILIFL